MATTNPDALDHESVAQLLRSALPEARVEIEASPVSGSPYRYVTAYLRADTNRPSTPDYEGPYVVISDGTEWGEEGILLGAFECYDGDSESQPYPSIQAALTAAPDVAAQLLKDVTR